MKKLCFIGLFAVIVCSWCYADKAKVISKGVEFRYYSPSKEANGETDFKGSTEVFETDQRIQFLDAYTDFMADYVGDPELNGKAVEKDQIQNIIQNLKPQPLTETRRTIHLEDWQSLGYRQGQITEETESISRWAAYDNVSIVDERLKLASGHIDHKLQEAMKWRFSFSWKASVSANTRASFVLSGACKPILEVGFDQNGDLYCRHDLKKAILGKYKSDTCIGFKAEVDLDNDIFNLYINEERVLYAVPLLHKEILSIDTLTISSSGELWIDDIFACDFVRDEKNVEVPYAPRLVIDQDFSVRPNISGWEQLSYDHSRWQKLTLPMPHGGFRYAGEDLYLRKIVDPGDFEKAILNFETLDPGGDIFINGKEVASITNRAPVRLDVTQYLRKETENLIAVKVNAVELENPMHHSCADRNIGWFAGRCQLELTSPVHIETTLVHTQRLDGNDAIQRHRITFENGRESDFKGTIEIRYSPWFPQEAPFSSGEQFEVSIPAGKTITRDFYIRLNNASLWTFKNPNLYKVQVLLKNAERETIDDYVLTTGIRTISQSEGMFKINGKDEMLNGVQNMGFRMPVENLARFNRCAPLEVLVEEMLMALNCGSNMFRVHVHAAKDTPDGIHDPRIAEICDQLGIMLVWTGGPWIREGDWEAIDFDNLGSYIRELYNHPSIVVWELGNHPNRFKSKPVQNSLDFVEKTMEAVLAVDRSRLISPTTFWQHTHIANDAGTRDTQGNAITAPVEYTHPLCTRGTQDAVTGYGADWEKLRSWPNGWTKDCLENKQRAFFNWEHEESIAQPNWNLSKGKPWHELQSYEWGYDDGSIGRKLQTNEWRASQGFQAFSAYESMKKQRLFGVAGFSWCCIRGGANSGTYKKPLIDCLGHPKLAWYIHKLVYQRVLAGSDNVDVVYGPDDTITPVIMNLDDGKNVKLAIRVLNQAKEIVQEFSFDNITIEEGCSVTRLKPLTIDFPQEGYYVIEYVIFSTP